MDDDKKSFEEEAKETAREFSDAARDTVNRPDNKKVLAGVLAILLGAFGIHKFILGYYKEGIIILAVTILLGVLTCGTAGWVMSVLGLVEGIIYLTKSDEEFYMIYQVGKRPWF